MICKYFYYPFPVVFVNLSVALNYSERHSEFYLYMLILFFKMWYNVVEIIELFFVKFNCHKHSQDLVFPIIKGEIDHK